MVRVAPIRFGANVLVGGGSSAEGRFCPGLRKRGNVAGLPCSDGCNRSVLAAARLVDGVCDAAGSETRTTKAAAAMPPIADAPKRRFGREDSAPKAHTSATVRVTSEAAKPNHRSGAEMAARDSFSVRQPRDYRHGLPHRPRWLTELEQIWLTRG